MQLFDKNLYQLSKLRVISFLVLFITIIFLDQLTKNWARNNLIGNPIYFGDRDLGFVYATNSGSAFSLFSNSTIFISIIAIIVVVILFFAIFKTKRNILSFSYMFIAIGAIGNLIDRFTQPPYWGSGSVTDFISIGWWATFNIADSAITIGAVLLIASSVFQRDVKNEQ